MQRNEYIYILNGILDGLKKNNTSNVNPPLSDKQIDAISTAVMNAIARYDAQAYDQAHFFCIEPSPQYKLVSFCFLYLPSFPTSLLFHHLAAVL